ncbi:MAG: hypothetical protein COS82_09295 [Zetaproteobacteria bacterium CG06_land_8_20_14_3_00_59_53]|nr:MAG: hypothetical protein AUK36_09800 [Zetaproteobacteria bacterium CG2_30_59_37]PIO90738.1 MAG: hypothetical protein COX56_00965 [Zetaproteobacteria bacterium CG23_combo_of_CG06-09_8_20_14_all_59_86]PIQ65310.1 MAG: hypothetical protein COV97_04565 [Zetaproteobacteria bacterium CG11_big_fil_rev_8_21_14_0_20_59_439]PIU69852.1 MAG: hypothetical protein COS82_09295 [Zetaproteobacteria bacterium CG06_land_8_20_14_3_00_59_53]PIU97378.1 MAG: hypothetical protein COS62_04005 [Zetaproteobacteria bac
MRAQELFRMLDPLHIMGPGGNEQDLISAQKQQVWVRIVLSALVLGYLAAHAPALMDYLQLAIVSTTVYCLFNLLSLRWISRQPYHLPRLLASPLFDIAFTCLGMWLDGGPSSPMYIMFFIIIVGNGLRFGNVMLLYSLSLSLIGLAIVSLLNIYGQTQTIDWLYLMLQLTGIIIVPGYTYILGMRLDKAQSARAQAEQDSVGLLDASPIPAFTFEAARDGDMQIRYANPAMERFCGVQHEELRGLSIARICIPEDVDALREGCAKVLLQLRPEIIHSFDIRSRMANGDMRNQMCQGSSIRWRGQLLGLCLMTDVTESERLHDQLESIHRQEYLNSVLGGMAHDFRNTLTNIIGTAEVMKMTAADHSADDKLDIIIESGEQGSEMINHLHHLMRGRKTKRGLINLQDSLYAAINLVRLRLPHHISLICSIDDDLPPVSGHATQIDQMVLLLIDNAAHAIRGSGRIEVFVEKDAGHVLARKPLPALRIRITDSGCGISAEDLPHVFESFWTTRKEQNAAGLGLTMVKRIVDWHHGAIDITSKPGRGTAVVIHLPPAFDTQKTSKQTTAASG